jgi:hypothetical protein
MEVTGGTVPYVIHKEKFEDKNIKIKRYDRLGSTWSV